MKHYTVRGICNMYSIHEGSVLSWIANGELRAVNVGKEPGKKKPRWRISEEAIKDFELLRSTQPKRTTTRRSRRKSTTPNFIT